MHLRRQGAVLEVPAHALPEAVLSLADPNRDAVDGLRLDAQVDGRRLLVRELHVDLVVVGLDLAGRSGREGELFGQLLGNVLLLGFGEDVDLDELGLAAQRLLDQLEHAVGLGLALDDDLPGGLEDPGRLRLLRSRLLGRGLLRFGLGCGLGRLRFGGRCRLLSGRGGGDHDQYSGDGQPGSCPNQ